MVPIRSFSLLPALIAVTRAQQACTSTTETHPSLTWSKCTSSGCTEVKGSVVVDSNWRWTHTVEGSTNCYTGNTWDSSICTNGTTCAEKCCVDGADYAGTYGVTTSGNQLSIDFVTKGAYSTNIGSRLYLLEDESTYQMFTLLGNEFTFDVDVSAISCGLNGALYFVSMDEDGGMAKNSGNKAGAKYGTGYCDAQCARDVKFINGVANVEGWEPSDTDSNSGTGNLGTCCPEMDIWEANDISTAFTPHPCKTLTQHSCTGDACGGTYSSTRYAGTCDPDGCDFNTYRQGNETFYGPGSDFLVDTTKKITVVTQFVAGTSGGLSEIKRFYVQNGKVIANAASTVSGTSGNSVNKDFCTAQKKAFGDEDDFETKGGFSGMSDALSAPMVLVMSLWDDHHANMLWLDSTYPTTATGAGAKRGTCATDSGVPATVESTVPNSSVSFSNIKFGPIGSTFDESAAGGSSSSSSSAAASPTTAVQSSASQTLATSVQTTVTQKSATLSTSSTAAVVSTTSVATEKASATSVAPVQSTSPVESNVQSATVLPSSSTPAGESQCGASTITATVTATVTVSATDKAASPSSTPGSDDDECEDDDDETSSAAAYGQCGGANWTGSTACASGYVCKVQNAYYSQCVAE